MGMALDASGPFEFFAVDISAIRPRTPFVESGYSVDLSGPGAVADEDALRNFAAGFADSLPNGKTVGTKFVDLPSGRAAKVTTRFTMDLEKVVVALVSHAYVVTRGERTVLFAWTTTPAREARYRPVFDTAMRSVRFRD